MPITSRLARKILTCLPLILPVFFYLAVALYWQSHKMYRITGDEPHYLLIAESLYKDHDLKVENNYLSQGPIHEEGNANLSDPVDMQRHVRNGYSMHNIGLPLILMLPYGLFGIGGAKIFMALVAGFWPYLLYKAVFQIIESKPWSILIALTLSLGLPYLPVSNQLYIDLLGGMVILYLAERVIGIFRGRRAPFTSPLDTLWFGLLAAFLPWLHIRLSAPATLLVLGYVYATRFLRQSNVKASARWLLLPVAMLACSGLLLAAYNQIAFGNALFGPYYGYLSFDVRKIALTLTGLHWDMAHGMFMQQPLLLLGLVGIVPLVKENWRAGVLLALLSLSVLLPNSMLSNWYGASSFVGRYQWAIVSLWVFPLAHAVKLLFKYRLLFLLPLCLVALLLQAWMASRWLYTDGLLINTGWPVWAAKNFYSESPALLLKLPFFKNVNDYTNLKDCLTHPANYACLILSAALVMTGWLWPRRATRTLPGVWSLSLIAVVCLLAFVPPAVPSWYITADALPSEVGAQGYQSRSAHEGETRAGHLVFGPYVTLMSGTYRVMLEYEADDNQARPHLDIVYDIQTRVIPYQDLPPSSANNGKFESEFQVDEEISMQKQFEFRVWYPGKGNLMVKRLNLAYLHP